MKHAIVTSFVAAASLLSQERTGPPDPAREDVIVRREGTFEGHVGGVATFDFVSSEMGLAGKVVKGAPYSAEAVTETTQTLADGNRITRKNTSALYRDGEGRTRREQTLPAIGPWASSGDAPQLVTISDPVANVTYMLETHNKSARKINGVMGSAAATTFFAPAHGISVAGAGPGVIEFEHKVEHKIIEARGAPARAAARVPGSGDAKKEDLGKRNIEGLLAEGTRTTVTVPAGAIGNERAIDIVTEKWYSPELQTLVMSKHSDPRMGETVYRLTRVTRAEPARSLFEVPSDYTVTERPPAMEIMRRKIPANRE